MIQRLHDRLTPEAFDRVQARVYDEPVRFNITNIDGTRSLVQPYPPGLRGLDAPTFLIDADDDEPHGLFPVFERIFTETWDRGRVVEN